VAARLLRRILVDRARSRQRAKRGKGLRPLSLDEALVVARERSSDLIAIDDALNALARIDSRKEQVVELRFFGGLSVEETAAVLNVSPGTVMRDWRLAKVWLMRELSRDTTDACCSLATNRRAL
jgi:RNA polymerase sigma factor (TIGR02999 family)